MKKPRENVPLDDSFGMYLRDIGRISLLTRAQEQDLGRRIRRGEEKAVHELVQANLRFVVSIAKRYMNRGIPLSDLVTAMSTGSAYVNLHTNDGVDGTDTGAGDFPGGEIRADITS